jgi:hypothetical protein
MSRIDSRHWKFSIGHHFQNGRHNAAQIPELIPDIEKFLTVSIFQNGCHNTAKIQHCSIWKIAFDLFFKPVVSGLFGRLETS